MWRAGLGTRLDWRFLEAGKDELWDAGDSARAADGQVQMKLMGKGNQVSEPENQITNAASPMN